MSKIKNNRHNFFFIMLFILSINYAEARTVSTIVQPIGTNVQNWDPALVNQYLEKWDSNIIPGVTDPFDTHYGVTEIQPTQSMRFVRVYTEPNSGPLGSFIVRASTIRNLTPQQIRDVLALPDVPQKLVYVRVPAGAQYGLWTGIAGPIMSPGYEWGNGGGEQIKIIGKETNSNPPADPARFADYSRLPADSYMNAQFIGNNALSYYQSVNSGNASEVAQYLDSHLPQPYSDMEDIYATLDYINADGPPELAVALNQISPINFDSYSTVAFRNDLLFENILFAHTQTSISQPTKKCFASWANLSGEQGDQTVGIKHIGFYYQTGVLTAGLDCQVLPNVKMGAAAAYVRDHIGWNISAGNANMNNAKLGIYSIYSVSDYFFNTAITGGYGWSSAQRNLNFAGDGIAVLSGLVTDTLNVYRNASSHQTGQNLGLYLSNGKNFQFNEWNLMPTAQVSYFYSRQDAFNESGADDLNLNVQNFNAQTIRTQLAILLGKRFVTQKGSLVQANIQLGWVHNFPLDNRTITASLPALGGNFSVYGYHNQTNEMLASASISSKVTTQVWVVGLYNADLSHGFNSQALSLIFKYYLDA
ncbi:MAG: autotransporter outer membrane beta-barrel domain-containing protein [Gammaproteobacteria bacterium]|nr:autotransporter outer membrane beta-barrel domain-containing protein [Gammaproteobacteria bacterium]